LHPRQLRSAREPSCPHCGCKKFFNIERWRRDAMRKKPRCSCNSYPFPHEKGTLRFCVHHERFDADPTEEELRDYESLIETPRG